MIVLDEQLLGRNLHIEMARWYPGAIIYVSSLRPNSVIKDEALPTLLREQNQPTFVTINETDFWQRIPASESYCVVCFALTDARVREIPQRLRALLEYPEFRTKAARMGKIVRVAEREIVYYTIQDRTPRRLE
ncbi:MAG: hypothetical protein HY741_10605 [Chloroflexi bacterium]|nr:hypothetical protein [Chloroflexota bacterium]